MSLREIVNDLQSIPVPAVDGPTTITSTENGDLLLLTDKEIVRATIRPSSSMKEQKVLDSFKLSVDTDLKNYDHIEANTDGSLVALWSATDIAVVEVTSAATTFHRLDISDDKANKVLQVHFHPLSQYTLVLLYESHLVVWNLRDMTAEGKQKFLLPSSTKFSAFSFGPQVEWLRFTIFLVSNKGDIYALCPVIPKGIMLPKAMATELWQWLYEKERQLADGGDESYRLESYVSVVRSFLSTYVGVESCDEDGYVLTHDTNLSTTELLDNSASLSNYTVSLQGPLRMMRPRGEASTDPVVSICVPGDKGVYLQGAAPVLAVASHNRVDLVLVDVESDSCGYIAPAWRPLDLSMRLLHLSSPDLLVADSFSIPSVDDSKTHLHLYADPMHGHCVHAVDARRGRAFLLWSKWLHAARSQDGDESASKCISTFSSPEPICGAVFLQDPYLGHLCMLRLKSQAVVAVNLSVHLKLAALQSAPRAASERSGASFGGEDNSRWRHALGLMTKAAQGLSRMPPVEMAVSEDDPAREVVGQSTAEQKKLLVTTAQTLDREVVAPLHDLAQATYFHYQIVQEMYRSQREAVEGVDASVGEPVDGLSLRAGLRNVLEALKGDQDSLRERVQGIHQRYEDLREQADRCLSMASALRKKVTPGERLYHGQLVQWSRKVSEMSREVDQLRAAADHHAQATVAPPSTPVSNTSFSFGSPVKPAGETSVRTPFMLRRTMGRAVETPVRSPYAPLPTAPIVVTEPVQSALTEEDAQLCLSILQEQAEKIAAFKKQVLALESRVDSAAKDATQRD